MKKSLIALAALATVGAAQAQSSVTVYGSMDLSYDSVKFENAGGNTGTAGQAKVSGINATENATAGALTSSRIGFRGTEDLGGGLRAGFNYELGIFGNLTGDSATTTTAALNSTSATPNAVPAAGGAALQTRTARLSLESAKAGRVMVGYGLTGLFDTVTGHSPLPGNNFYGDVAYSNDGSAPLARARSSADNRILAGAVRMNGINYITPSFNGLTARVDFGAGRQDWSDARTNNALVSNLGLTLNYAKGPLALAGTVHQLKADQSTDLTVTSGATPVANNVVTKTDFQAFSARYTVTSNLTVNALYAKNKSTELDAVVGKSDVQQVGIKYDMGKTSLVAQYGVGQTDRARATTTFSAADVDRARSGYQLAAIHNLSKRTNVYALYGYQDVEYKRAEASPLTAVSAGVKEKVSGYAVGIRHSF